ncbi:phenol hydroxylase [Xanthomonas oryzae pv. oryzae KACC 10331]|uniref:Phenol hydroxylase n=1 Tax=Xanthomonas oryzae pv. oryzae (strain KACC10331 / KXO85) TaxID=291331 RepID=Q5GWI0_XANOR|nr:phenol hydroxylase [Xanthomonas oryzae pv. oryzae KACC 10331]
MPSHLDLALRQHPGDPVHCPNERIHERRGRLVVDHCRCVELLDAAAVEDGHPIGQFQRFFLIVGDEYRGQAGAFMQLAEPAAQIAAHLRIQRAERLVEQQHARLDCQRTRQRHALPLAAGELGGITLFQTLQLHQRQQFLHACTDARFGPTLVAAAYAQAERDVLEHVHMLEQCVMLEHEADPTRLHAHAGGIFIAEQHLPAICMLQPGHDAQQRGLARAGGSEQRQQLALAHIQGDVVQRGKGLELLAQMVDADAHGHLSGGGWRPANRRAAIPDTSSAPRSAARSVPAARRRRMRRCRHIRCREFPHAAAACWCVHGYARTPPTQRRIRPSHAPHTAARHTTGPNGYWAASLARTSASRSRPDSVPPVLRRCPAAPSAASVRAR